MKKAFLFFVLFSAYYIHAAQSPIYPDIVVFDFGGVVGYTDNDMLTKKVEKALGVRHSQAKALTAKALSAKSMEAFWLIYETKSGLELPFNWASQFKQMRRQSLRIDPKIYTIIQELKSHGKKVALLSNVPASRAKDIRKLGLYKPFHPAILSCDIGVEKPNKKAFRVLLKKLGNVDPNRCFFIDDKIENVNAALRLGIQAVQYESPKKLRWQLALRNILPPKKAY